MKKLLLVVMCTTSISAVYADGGLFGLLGSAMNAVSGNGSSPADTSSNSTTGDANGGSNNMKVNKETVDGNWTVNRYEEKERYDSHGELYAVPSCSRG